MKLTREALPQSRQKITVSLTEQDTVDFFTQAKKQLVKGVKVSGFRPGKVPEAIALKQLIPDQIREEALRLVVASCWQEALKNIEQLPIEDPTVEVEKFSEKGPGRFIFLYDHRPNVKLGNWQGIKVKKEKATLVADKDIEAALKSFAQSRAQRLAKNAPAAKGDELQVNMKGSIAGQPVKKLTVEKMSLQLGRAGLIPGMEEKLLGIKRNEVRQFSLLLPTNHFEKDLAGKKVDFKVEAKEVYSLIVPEATDELAKEAGYKTLADMRQKLQEYMAKEQVANAKAKQEAQWLKEFEKQVTVELPQSLITKEVERLRQQWQEFIAQRNLSAKDWLEARQTTLAEMEKDWQKSAVGQLKIGLGLAEIAKVKKTELKDENDFRSLLSELSGSKSVSD